MLQPISFGQTNSSDYRGRWHLSKLPKELINCSRPLAQLKSTYQFRVMLPPIRLNSWHTCCGICIVLIHDPSSHMPDAGWRFVAITVNWSVIQCHILIRVPYSEGVFIEIQFVRFFKCCRFIIWTITVHCLASIGYVSLGSMGWVWKNPYAQQEALFVLDCHC